MTKQGVKLTMNVEEHKIRELNEAVILFRAISVVNKEDWESVAKELGLDSSVQLNILWIASCYEGVRVTQIADWTFWHPSSIVIHVKKMMEKGLVTISKSDRDGRVVNVYLTEEGRKVIEKNRSMAKQSFRIYEVIEALKNRYSQNVINLFFECLYFMANELHGEEKIRWIKESERRIINGDNSEKNSDIG